MNIGEYSCNNPILFRKYCVLVPSQNSFPFSIVCGLEFNVSEIQTEKCTFLSKKGNAVYHRNIDCALKM